MASANQGAVSKEIVNINGTCEQISNNNKINKTSFGADILTDTTIDETIIAETQDDFIEQINSLQADIEAGCFETNLQPCKRTTKNKLLSEECFDFNIYKQKQCGFTTSRPIFWLQSIDEYVKSSEDITGKFYYKSTRNSDKYSVVKININYQITKKVVLVINIAAGVILVKGEHYENWIQEEFPKLYPGTCKEHVKHAEPPGTPIDEDIEKEVTALWRHSEANKISIENLDGTQKALRDEFDQRDRTVNEDISHLKREMEKADEKLKMFLDTSSEEYEKGLKKLSATVERKIHDICEKVGEFKMNITRQVQEFVNNHHAVKYNIMEIRKLKSEIDEQKREIKDVINEYKMFTDDNTVTNTEDWKKDKRKNLPSLRHDLKSQKRDILDLEKKLQNFKENHSNKEEENTNTRNDIARLENDVKNIETLVRNYSKQRNSFPTTTTDIHAFNNIPLDETQNFGEKEVDLLICMDSNSKYINFRKLWTLRNSKRTRCYTLNQLHEYISKSDITKLNHILINIGVNDIDTKSGVEVFTEIKQNIDLLRTKYPYIKIILCEVTPRKDDRDYHVIECNRLIHELALEDRSIIIADHTNLRENSYNMLKDIKHVSEYRIGAFVINIKKALCAAYGKIYIGRRHIDNRNINARLMGLPTWQSGTPPQANSFGNVYDTESTWNKYV